MFKRLLPAIVLIAAGTAIVLYFGTPRVPQPNPDPNHTHADFLVMLDGTAVDFTDPFFMTGESTEDHTRDRTLPAMRQFLHLHDGIGTVIHRHKPGLTLAEFFDSISVGFTAECIVYRTAEINRDMQCSEHPWRMIVNGQERPFSVNYDFSDGDAILITTASDDAALAAEIDTISDDACRYSQTCPWRGKPPAENCIADPTVPCVAPTN